MNSWVVFGVGQKNCATGWHCGGFADNSFPRCRVLLYSAISIFAIMAYLAPSDFAQAGPGLCPKSGTRRGKVASVSERLELTLTDRIQLKIAGVEPPHPTPENSELDIVSRDRLAQWLVGQDIAYQPVGPSLDRWGRLPAFVFAPRQDIGERQDDPLLPVGEALLDAGLARYDPGPAAHDCKASLLAAEAAARTAALGLWADPYYSVIAATDHPSFAEKFGTAVIVEGRITAIADRRPRIMLYFGPRPGWDFSVAFFQQSSKAFEESYASIAAFNGRNVRVRGLLDGRFGPQIEISDPDEIEVIENQRNVEAVPSLTPAPR